MCLFDQIEEEKRCFFLFSSFYSASVGNMTTNDNSIENKSLLSNII